MRDEEGPDPTSGPLDAIRWFLSTDTDAVVFVRETLKSVLGVALVGLLLFGISGVWPPMVAVESGSMEPHMSRGDLVFLMEEHRLVPGAAHDGTGVVTYQNGQDANYRKFGGYGDVVIFAAPERNRPPVIHRARFWVERGENWYQEANPRYLMGATSCAELQYCPAPHAGFITKGDNNQQYDQVIDISPPVKPSWIHGTAELRIPYLGYVRLLVSTTSVPVSPVAPVADSPAALDASSASRNDLRTSQNRSLASRGQSLVEA